MPAVEHMSAVEQKLRENQDMDIENDVTPALPLLRLLRVNAQQRSIYLC